VLAAQAQSNLLLFLVAIKALLLSLPPSLEVFLLLWVLLVLKAFPL